jgi:hypothetical protein
MGKRILISQAKLYVLILMFLDENYKRIFSPESRRQNQQIDLILSRAESVLLSQFGRPKGVEVRNIRKYIIDKSTEILGVSAFSLSIVLGKAARGRKPTSWSFYYLRIFVFIPRKRWRCCFAKELGALGDYLR